jgi:hypothetical protein
MTSGDNETGTKNAPVEDGGDLMKCGNNMSGAVGEETRSSADRDRRQVEVRMANAGRASNSPSYYCIILS